MANEITVTAALSYANPAQNVPTKSLTVSNLLFSITGKNFAQDSQVIPTTAGGTAINLQGLSTLGWFFIKNDDPTNYVEILNAVSGTVLLRIPPGGIAIGYFDSSVTAPAAMAHTASVMIEYLVLEQ